MANILDEMSRPSTPYRAIQSEVGVLLIHGFLGSPYELRPLADTLYNAGYSVSALLLPGHGGNPENLKGVRWQSWYSHCQQELERLKKDCSRVIVIGFSMGGLLASLLVAKQQSDALVLMAAAFQLRSQKQMAFAKWVGYLMPWMYPFKDSDFTTSEVQANVRQYLPDADFSDQQLIARLRKEVRIPLSSIGELVAVQRVATAQLTAITVPTLIIQGKNDQTVNPKSADIAREKLLKTQASTVLFASGHILMYEAEHLHICQSVLQWLQTHCPVERQS